MPLHVNAKKLQSWHAPLRAQKNTPVKNRGDSLLLNVWPKRSRNAATANRHGTETEHAEQGGGRLRNQGLQLEGCCSVVVVNQTELETREANFFEHGRIDGQIVDVDGRGLQDVECVVDACDEAVKADQFDGAINGRNAADVEEVDDVGGWADFNEVRACCTERVVAGDHRGWAGAGTWIEEATLLIE